MAGHIGADTLVVMGSGRHACWGYNDEDSFWREAEAFLRDGIDAGERVMKVIPLNQVPDLPPADDPAQIATLTREHFFGHPPCENLQEWERGFRRLIGETLADGFDGVRLVSDSTSVIADTHQPDLIAWELRLGRLIAEYPLTVVCGFQVSEIDKARASDLVSVHTSLRGPISVPLATFHLDEDTLTLRGELDSTTLHLLELAFAQVDGDVTVDLTDVEFMDLRSIQRLRRFIEESGGNDRSVQLRGLPDIVERTWDLLRGYW